MFNKTIIFILFLLGLTWSFSVSAATCPTDNGSGTGCNTADGYYYCSATLGGVCTNLTSYNVGSIPTNLKTFCDDVNITRPACTPGVDCLNAASYNCGVPQTCNTGYTLCNLAGDGNPSWPTSAKCKANVAVPLNCSSYNQCTGVCSACNTGYELLGNVCVGATVKLGTDSVVFDRLKNSINPLMSILSSGNVGIGTTTPGTKLTFNAVTGDQINVSGGHIIGLNTTPMADSEAVPLLYLKNNYTPLGSGEGGIGVGISGQTLRHDGTSWVANSTLFNDGTNIGIGTTAPGQKLDVAGNIKSTGYGIFPTGIVPAATGAPDGKIFSPSGSYVAANTWGMNYNEGAPDYIEFVGASSVTAKIALDTGAAQFGLSGGSVGIGLTNPSYKLDVNGSIHGTSYYSSDGTIGTSTTINVRKADDTGACTITVKNGLITTTTCP